MVLFSSITQFVEQVNRQKKWQKRDTLDTLVRIYIGPTEQVDSFKPANGSPDAQYNLMTVLSATDRDLGHGRGVSEVTVTYQGKLTNGSYYSSTPTISTSWSDGEVSYTQSGTTWPAGAPVQYSYSHRYTGRNVTIAYITNSRPSGEPTNLGKAKGYLGFDNEFDILTAVNYSAPSGASSGYFQDMRCTDVRIQDLADGWFRVTETYQSRLFPTNAQGSPIAGKIFYSSTLVTPDLQGDAFVSPQKYESEVAAQAASNTGNGGTSSAQVAAASAVGAQVSADQSPTVRTSGQLPGSPLGSVAADTAQKLGIDPAWQASDQAIGASVATNAPTGIATGSGDASASGGSGIGDYPI